ncbi:IMP cyclohydrolase [Lacticaseibacillus rhamnosus]|nr:IMP cyclohydrolase / Phosphoribosylaminoimidazolecarboxamide formyltransferase [Lacticaseibacillus rhamnosus LRHMDP2]EKS52361.1 IMP cyclohydrolase / Phosphoribosylaminoimidazolecarboxamide formyltransferase [Lacticaseibacillus rhamnosus LRHMDP3]MCT3169674.1 IMP cyclohydrolase [Lacticaseibacillus rhamnosus]MCT3179177.1 IMP cyclohydrolase [Lacticaseibacillus rhamnosus]MCT3184346.1 IMP cyclohydrolase [Lacticaseibacillus rhamnosus]
MRSITRSPAQKSACKDLRRNGQSPAITPEATYTPTSNRAGSRSQKMASRFDLLNAYAPIVTNSPWFGTEWSIA